MRLQRAAGESICFLRVPTAFAAAPWPSHLSSLLPIAVTKAALVKGAAAAIPVATLSAPAFAMDSIVEALPSTSLSLEVQFGAYLAILLGTFLPCLFLVNLYIQ